MATARARAWANIRVRLRVIENLFLTVLTGGAFPSMGSSRIFRTAILKQENLSKHIHTHYGPGVSFALIPTTEQL